MLQYYYNPTVLSILFQPKLSMNLLLSALPPSALSLAILVFLLVRQKISRDGASQVEVGIWRELRAIRVGSVDGAQQQIMAHLFITNDFYDYRNKILTTLKKSLQLKIETLTDTHRDPLHPLDTQEDVVQDASQIYYTFNGEQLALPTRLKDVRDYSSFLNMHTLAQELDQDDIQELLEHVPGRSLEHLREALEGKGLHETHLQGFQRKMKSGYFTGLREKAEEVEEKLNMSRMKEIYQNLLKTIVAQRSNPVKTEKFVYEEEDSSVESVNDLESVEDMSENSQATETEEELDDFIDEEYNQRVFFRYDYSKIKGQEELLALGEEKIDKKLAMYKITLPTRPKNSEWVDNYRRQEYLRYSNPTKPWVYNCEDGRKVTVAPVAKKISVVTGKPRDHPLLKSERPACVTILTLVRDAAARLPNGVGTRADISELLKESQYINEDLPEEKLSNIVSGALDRLHYMTDACVKYDSEKKLWLYLHSDRNYEHPGWGEDGEDYLDRLPTKRKKRDFE